MLRKAPSFGTDAPWDADDEREAKAAAERRRGADGKAGDQVRRQSRNNGVVRTKYESGGSCMRSGRLGARERHPALASIFEVWRRRRRRLP